MSKYLIKIEAIVTTTIDTETDLAEGETIEDFCENRHIDIYLHGAGEDGHSMKEDLGADRSTITAEPVKE